MLRRIDERTSRRRRWNTRHCETKRTRKGHDAIDVLLLSIDKILSCAQRVRTGNRGARGRHEFLGSRRTRDLTRTARIII